MLLPLSRSQAYVPSTTYNGAMRIFKVPTRPPSSDDHSAPSPASPHATTAWLRFRATPSVQQDAASIPPSEDCTTAPRVLVRASFRQGTDVPS